MCRQGTDRKEVHQLQSCPTGSASEFLATLCIALHRNVPSPSIRAPEEHKNPAEIVDLCRSEIAPINRSRMLIEQKNSVSSQYLTAFPNGHRTPQSVGTQSLRDMDSFHQYSAAVPANFIAWKPSNPLDEGPVPPDVTAHSSPIRFTAPG